MKERSLISHVQWIDKIYIPHTNSIDYYLIDISLPFTHTLWVYSLFFSYWQNIFCLFFFFNIISTWIFRVLEKLLWFYYAWDWIKNIRWLLSLMIDDAFNGEFHCIAFYLFFVNSLMSLDYERIWLCTLWLVHKFNSNMNTYRAIEWMVDTRWIDSLQYNLVFVGSLKRLYANK